MKKIKKAFVSLTAAVISTASLCIVPLASAGVSGKYKTYSCYFEAKPNTYIGLCEANTTYNTSNTEFYRNRNGNLGGDFSVINAGSGKISVEYRNSSPTKDSGYLGYVSFKTTSTYPEFKVTSLINDRGNNLIVNESIEIIPVLIGDANQDGSVTIADSTAILQSLGNPDRYGLSKKGKLAADVNFDGVVTNADALLIQQLDAGMINGF